MRRTRSNGRAPDPVPAGLAVRSVAAAAGCAVAEQDEVLVIERPR